MEQVKRFIKEHKKAVLVAVFFLMVFVGCSAVSAVHVAQQRAQEAATQQKETEPAGGASQTEGAQPDAELTDTQKQAIENYDDDTKDFVDTLCASVWSADGGRYTLRFGDTEYTETVDGKTETHSYAILRLERGSDTSGAEICTAAFETDTGTHIVTYTNLTGSGADGSDKISSTLSSGTMFALKDTAYERADAVKNITITGLNSEVTKLFGGDANKLTEELSRWCAVHYPSVTNATWQKVASIDWDGGTVATDFTLNSETPVNITVVYMMETGEFEFSY